MSSNIDQRIVEMKFEGEAFLSGAGHVIEALFHLKSGLNDLKGGAADINSLDEAGRHFSLSGMVNGISGVTHHFSLMRIAGLTAFTSLVRQGLYAGENLLKSLTIDPIKAGLQSYETKINAIQTILANTQSEGTNLKQVTSALNQLNQYSNLTVYNFADMARNIGTFTAAGVGLKTSVASIKGIANLAALSGSSAQQASTGMYQLSQAIAAGVVKLQDWNSVVNAGFGGKVFQNALIQTARVNGVAVDAMIKKYGSFRQSLQSGWLSAKILTQTLSEFTGDLSAKQLRAMGFTQAETEAILKQAKVAVQSATQIRTISQLMAALKDDVSTAWAAVWEGIIGNFKEAPKFLTSVFNTLSNGIIGPIYKLADFLKEFDKLGGRAAVIKAFVNIFHVLGQVLDVVKKAFESVFPPLTVGSVVSMAKGFLELTSRLKLSGAAMQDIKTIFTGVFSIFKIVFDLIGGIAHGLGLMFGAAKSGGGSFLGLIATIANFITHLRKAIESSGAFTKVFGFIGRVLSVPIHLIGVLVSALGHVGGLFVSIENVAGPFVKKIGATFSHLTDSIMNGIRSGNFSAVVGLVNNGLLGLLLLAFRKFILRFTSPGGIGKEVSGIFGNIKDSFEQLTGTLKTMQAELKSKILENIAISVALLAASLLVLSTINTKKLAISLGAITVMMGQLIGALALIGKAGAGLGIVKMAALTLALNGLSLALVTLSAAVAILGHMSWSQLLRGLAGVAVLLATLAGAMLLFSKDTKGLLITAISMQYMAIALNLLARAVTKLGALPIGNIVKGTVAIAALLAVVAGFNAISGDGKGLIGTAIAMVLIGAALNIMSGAVAKLGSLPLGTLVKGLVAIAAVLLILAGAMYLMEGSLPGAIALVIAAVSIEILGKALLALGNQSWASVAKALVALFGALLLISAAMIAMEAALPGAAALLVVAASLAILIPLFIALGHMSWGDIAKGLVALAGVFIVFAAAGALLTPVIPSMIALGVAVAILGAGLALAGAGVFLFATGLALLGTALTVSGVAIYSFTKSILSIVPLIVKEIGLGIIDLIKLIGDSVELIAQVFGKLATAMLKELVKLIPLAQKALVEFLKAFLLDVNKYQAPVIKTVEKMFLNLLDNIRKNEPKFISEGQKIIIGFLNGIRAHIQDIQRTAADLIITFINGIGSNVQRIVDAGVNMIVRLVNGIADKIRQSSPALKAAGYNLATAIIDGITSGIIGGLNGLSAAGRNAGNALLNAAKGVLGISSPSTEFVKVGAFICEGAALGIRNNTSVATSAVETTGKAMLKTLGDTLSKAHEVVSDNMDLHPVITPVIDLTQAKKGFGALHDLSKKQIIAATSSTDTARSISAGNLLAARDAGLAVSTTTLEFNQTNISPKALSAADIYRKTKNQLSIAKGELNRSAHTS